MFPLLETVCFDELIFISESVFSDLPLTLLHLFVEGSSHLSNSSFWSNLTLILNIALYFSLCLFILLHGLFWWNLQKIFKKKKTSGWCPSDHLYFLLYFFFFLIDNEALALITEAMQALTLGFFFFCPHAKLCYPFNETLTVSSVLRWGWLVCNSSYHFWLLLLNCRC